MKKALITICLLFSFCMASALDESYKIYSYDADKVFMASLSVISSDSKYDISEIQTKNGYILFFCDSRFYLLTVTKRYKNQTEVKVLPQNSDYTKGSTVAKDIFLQLETELNKPMELII